MNFSPEQAQKFANDFWRRFENFRRIELEQIVGPFRYSDEAFALLRDAELCYAAKAYFASIVMAHSIIEIHLKKVEGLTGTAHELFKKAGIIDEVDWLRKLRNDIVHGNSSSQVTYDVDEELATVWERYCLKAFEFMHALPVRLHKANAGG